MSTNLVCSSCGASLSPGAKACDACGQPVSASAAPQVSAESWSAPTPAPAPHPAATPTDRWGSPQSDPSRDDPARWGAASQTSYEPPFVVDPELKRSAKKSMNWILIGVAVIAIGCLALIGVVVAILVFAL